MRLKIDSGSNQENERVLYFDILNIFACISVIALHCNGCFWQFSYERYWKTSVIIDKVKYISQIQFHKK